MNRKIIQLIALLILFIACSSGILHEQAVAGPEGSEARVIKVNDGDTVTLLLRGKLEKTRLIGIDAPELGQRPWGIWARKHLIELMDRTGWTVAVETDVITHDKYGRLLVYLRSKNNELINERMILDGYAVLFTISPNVKYTNALTRAERRARREQRGIWGPIDGLKERPFRYRQEHPRL